MQNNGISIPVVMQSISAFLYLHRWHCLRNAIFSVIMLLLYSMLCFYV